MVQWVLFFLAMYGLYCLLAKVAKNTGEAYYTAAMNERFGGSIIPALRKFYVVCGTIKGNKDTVVKALEGMGCTRKAA